MTGQSAPGAPIRVLIVDDDAYVRESLSMFLTTVDDFTLVGACADGTYAVEAVRAQRPDVVLMDVRLQVMDGAQATRIIAAEYPGVKVIGWTSLADDDTIAEMLDSGACGFLLKTTRHGALADAIRAAFSGLTIFPPDAVHRWRAMRSRPPAVGLDPQEWAVLECLDKGLTNREIAERLYSSQSSVKAQLRSLMRKLDANGRTQLVARAHALGLLPRSDQD